VISGRTNDEVKAEPERVWRSDLPAAEAAVELRAPAVPAPTADELVALDELPGAGPWEVFGRRLRLTDLDKVLFPGRPGEEPLTKRELVRYRPDRADDPALPGGARPEHTSLPGGRRHQPTYVVISVAVDAHGWHCGLTCEDSLVRIGRGRWRRVVLPHICHAAHAGPLPHRQDHSYSINP